MEVFALVGTSFANFTIAILQFSGLSVPLVQAVVQEEVHV